jgi:cellulose synthase/poly-beta-1,6-N-acetylglucosamine synthase-like glycosyltransferase
MPDRVKGLVSVITATYNMAGYIGETLDAILAQDYPHIESIIIDDGSTDNTMEVLEPYLKDPRVRVVQQANAGQTVAKNRGIAEAKGEFIAFCDADDTWRQDKLTLQIPRFDDPEVGVVFSDIICIDGEGEVIDIRPMDRVGGKITAPLLVDNYVPFPTSVARASVLEEVNGFDESLTMSIDYDLWLRISVKYLFAYVEEPLANYRIWEGQMSKKTGERLDNFFKLLERFLADNPDVVTQAEKNEAWSHVYVTRGWWHSAEGRKSEALADYAKAMKLNFLDQRLWRRVGALVLNRD